MSAEDAEYYCFACKQTFHGLEEYRRHMWNSAHLDHGEAVS